MRSLAVAGLLLMAWALSAEAQDIPETHVLLLDRSALKSADSKDVPEDIRTSASRIIKTLMVQYGANAVLDRSVTVAPVANVDITARVQAQLKLAHPEWIVAQPEAVSTDRAPISWPTRAVMLDFVTLRSGSLPADDPAMAQALRDFAGLHGASFLIDRRIVVFAEPSLDVTAEAQSYLELFRKTGKAPSELPIMGAGIVHMGVVDRRALLTISKAGIALTSRIKAIVKDAQDALHAKNDAMLREKAALEKQIPTLPPAEKAQKVVAFERRAKAFQQEVQQRQAQINAANAAAQRQIEDAAGPIVRDIAKAEGINLLVDKQALVLGATALDMTPLAIQKLDAALPSVDVVLPSPPADK